MDNKQSYLILGLFYQYLCNRSILLLWIWAPQDPAIMVRSLLLKSRKELARDVSNTATHVDLADDVIDTVWLLNTKGRHTRQYFCDDFQTLILNKTDHKSTDKMLFVQPHCAMVLYRHLCARQTSRNSGSHRPTHHCLYTQKCCTHL